LSATTSLGCGLKTGFSGCETEKSGPVPLSLLEREEIRIRMKEKNKSLKLGAVYF
jgi:hypothetical protein